MPHKQNHNRLEKPPRRSPTERLQKALANAGLGSRREVERWIAEGRLSVNGATAQPGQHFQAGMRLTLDSKPLLFSTPRTSLRVLMCHKPEGDICTRHDPQKRPTVFDRLPPIDGGRWIGIGRLDINSSGLMLFCNNGALAHHLMHPSANIEREYLVRVHGNINQALLQRLCQGVMLEDKPAHFTRIRSDNRTGSGPYHWFVVTLMRGHKREVRRLWESQGVQVSRLKRIRFGPIALPPLLYCGQWRELTTVERQTLFQDTHYRP